MSKRIFLDEQGALRIDASQCLMVQGTAARIPAATPSDLAKVISDCSSDQAVALGSLRDDLSNSVPITVDSNWRGLLALLYLLGSKPGCTMFMKLWQIGVAGRAHGAAIELRRKGGTAEAATSTPQITLIKKYGPDPLMSKRIFVDEQGGLRIDGSQCLMVQGTAARVPAATPSDLAKIISDCSSDQAIALGSLRTDFRIPYGSLCRGKSRITPVPSPAPGSLSIIVQGYPPGSSSTSTPKACLRTLRPALKQKGMWNALLTVAPGIFGQCASRERARAPGCFAVILESHAGLQRPA